MKPLAELISSENTDMIKQSAGKEYIILFFAYLSLSTYRYLLYTYLCSRYIGAIRHLCSGNQDISKEFCELGLTAVILQQISVHQKVQLYLLGLLSELTLNQQAAREMLQPSTFTSNSNNNNNNDEIHNGLDLMVSLAKNANSDEVQEAALSVIKSICSHHTTAMDIQEKLDEYKLVEVLVKWIEPNKKSKVVRTRASTALAYLLNESETNQKYAKDEGALDKLKINWLSTSNNEDLKVASLLAIEVLILENSTFSIRILSL